MQGKWLAGMEDRGLLSGLSSGARAVLHVLAVFAGATAETEVSVGRVAKHLAAGRRSVTRWLAELEAAKVVTSHRRGRGSWKRTIVVPPDLLDDDPCATQEARQKSPTRQLEAHQEDRCATQEAHPIPDAPRDVDLEGLVSHPDGASQSPDAPLMRHRCATQMAHEVKVKEKAGRPGRARGGAGAREEGPTLLARITADGVRRAGGPAAALSGAAIQAGGLLEDAHSAWEIALAEVGRKRGVNDPPALAASIAVDEADRLVRLAIARREEKANRPPAREPIPEPDPEPLTDEEFEELGRRLGVDLSEVGRRMAE